MPWQRRNHPFSRDSHASSDHRDLHGGFQRRAHANAKANPALKESPAPVVSAAKTFIAGICRDDVAVTISAPFSPNVITTCFTPLLISSLATVSSSMAASGLRPVNTLASV